MARGEIINLKVYQRVVNDTQIMRKYNAVGLSKEILEDLIKSGIHLIRILKVSDYEPTNVYYTTVARFLNSELNFEYIPGDINLFVPFAEMIPGKETRQKALI